MPRPRSALPLFALLVLALVGAGCHSYPLRARPTVDPVDESVLSPKFQPGKYRKIMIIPPSGTVRGQFDSIVAIFERELLKNGITVISGAITGRVVLEVTRRDDQSDVKEEEKRSGTGADLSDAERALIMAKKTGADALLQIGELAWSEAPVPTRWFVLDRSEPQAAYREVSSDEYATWTRDKYTLASPVLSVVGRLMDVESGEVMAAFKIGAAANGALPQEYYAMHTWDNGPLMVETESFDYSSGAWVGEAKNRMNERAIRLIAQRITGAPAPSPAR